MSGERLARAAFWCVAALIAAYQILPPSYDGQDHAHRIVMLADQLRAGAPSLLIEDRATGSVLPIFVYYSVLPYLPSLLLNLAGLPAFVALKLVLAAATLVLAAGTRALIESLPDERRRPAYLAGALFLSANAVYGLWVMRAALAEIWVFALVPWVVVALLRGRRLLLFGLLLTQLCAHPIVFGHALAATLLATLAIAPPDMRRLARAGLPALLAALVVSAPFWLPQMLWKDYILGTAGLPVRFADTFFAVAELARPLHPQTLGIWLPIAVALMLALGGRRQPMRVWLLAAAFVVTQAIQTRPLFALADAIPPLGQSLLVWRLMFPAAFFGFAALALGWPTARVWSSHLLHGLTLLSVAAMAAVMVIDAPGSLRFWFSGAVNDDVARRQYVGTVHGWAVREYAPSYARLANACDIEPAALQEVDIAAIRHGVRATAPHLSIRGAPFGTVTYLADGRELVPRACGDNLRLGPLPAGAEVRMSQTGLDRLLVLRLLVIVALCGVLAAATIVRRRPPTTQ
ncbi:MAG: hypothetical protein FJX20_15905 [Alphaproteobacteria bacterium]|nr:hypothetical protein [Alphaproteobacteria bacterium]